MKASILSLFLLAALAACTPPDLDIVSFRSRNDRGPHQPGSGERGGLAEPGGPGSFPEIRQDTTLYFSAVRFPDGYDWQRDTAYGSVPFELLLFKDFEPVLALPSGPDACFVPDPDRHHLLSGHLYTERMVDGTTRIGRDGVELFRFAGREYLVGLLEDGEDLFTLSRPAKGPGFSFRRNGEALIVRTDGAPFGSLAEPSYAGTGALYRDQGAVCFCFSAGSGAGRTFCAVRDGQESPLDGLPPGAPVLDLKLRQGEALALQDPVRGCRLGEGRIWPQPSGYAVTGRFADGAGYYSGFLDAQGGPQRLCDEEAALYRTAQGTFAVSADAAGTVRWYGPESGQEALPCHFLTPACASFPGGVPWLALTPRDTQRRPFVRTGARVREVDVNGYVSSLAVTVSRLAPK